MKSFYLIAIIPLALVMMSFTKANPQRLENFEVVKKTDYDYGTSSFVEKRIFLSSFIWHIYTETISAKSTKEDGTNCEDDTLDPVLSIEYNKFVQVIEKYNK